MKNLLLATFALAAINSGSALAADLPVAYMPRPTIVPVSSWTGFYVGAGWGYGMYNLDTVWYNVVGGPFLPLTQTQGGRGWLGTITAGFDYQFNSAIVGGVFADYDAANIKGTIQNQGPFTVGTMNLNSAWAVGARLGWLTTPAILSYINGGYTQGHFSSADMNINLFPVTATSFSSVASMTYNGWFIGGGLEANYAPGWFWRNEYRFAAYGNKNLPDVCVNAGFCALGDPVSFVDIKPYVQTVRSEIIYKFNWGG